MLLFILEPALAHRLEFQIFGKIISNHSTADFFLPFFHSCRGPKGVWTLEKEGKSPQVNVSFAEAIPTKCHMALKALLDSGHIKYIASQNIDGLHMRSGVKRRQLAELHGNMFVENCDKCRK